MARDSSKASCCTLRLQVARGVCQCGSELSLDLPVRVPCVEYDSCLCTVSCLWASLGRDQLLGRHGVQQFQ